MSPLVRLLLFAGAWLIWALALFALRGQRRQKAVLVDPRGRLGIALQMFGFVSVCTHSPNFWNSDIEAWRAIAGTGFALSSIALFWNAVGSLGRQWRFDAGLNRDHELVQTGAYRVVRHPIYASMLGMFLADAFWLGTMPAWPIALVLFLAGTEVRVHVEDGLLRERFGERFVQWRKSVPAYVPYVR